ncbi:hypothetical protein NDU88_004535 [Pleurodeles waltl]|uniref:Uncharacterized protein n=1 Tax=Pleurodeles waltl TaxID=8319 RepID=A0AAV7MU69_PLEWA|nr:hypothetical protein NDU88_004535 [Pleurodeles waltl]
MAAASLCAADSGKRESGTCVTNGQSLKRWPHALAGAPGPGGLCCWPRPFPTTERAHDGEQRGEPIDQGYQACGPYPKEARGGETCGTPPPHQWKQSAARLCEDSSRPRQRHCWPCPRARER